MEVKGGPPGRGTVAPYFCLLLVRRSEHVFAQQTCLCSKLFFRAVVIAMLDQAVHESLVRRNATVGHPTELQRKGEVSAHGISRSTIGKDGFL